MLNGAQPTQTVKNILSDEGVYLMKHLLGGVKKGAFDQATAEAKFAAWKAEKKAAADSFLAKQNADKQIADKKRNEEEVAKNKAKAEAIAKKKAEALEAQAAAAAEEVAEEAAAE